MTRTNCGQCMGANPAGARAETGALSRECHLTAGCARSSAAQCFAAICSAAWPAAVCASDALPERLLSGGAVRRAEQGRGGCGSQRCCVRGALPSTPYPAKLFAALDGSVGDAAVCVRGALPNAVCPAELFAALDGRVASGGLRFRRAPEHPLSGGAVCRAGKGRGAAAVSAVALERHSRSPSVRRAVCRAEQGRGGDAAVCASGEQGRGRCGGLRFRRTSERLLSGGAVRRAGKGRGGGGSQRCCVRDALPIALCPAELFAAPSRGAGAAAAVSAVALGAHSRSPSVRQGCLPR